MIITQYSTQTPSHIHISMNIDGQRQGMIRTKAIACAYDTISASVEPDSSTSKSKPSDLCWDI